MRFMGTFLNKFHASVNFFAKGLTQLFSFRKKGNDASSVKGESLTNSEREPASSIDEKVELAPVSFPNPSDNTSSIPSGAVAAEPQEDFTSKECPLSAELTNSSEINQNENPKVPPIPSDSEIIRQIQNKFAHLAETQNRRMITYEDFDHLFGSFPNKVQYEIVRRLEVLRYELVDELPKEKGFFSVVPSVEKDKDRPAAEPLPSSISNNGTVSQSNLDQEMIFQFAKNHIHRGMLLRADFDQIYSILSPQEKIEAEAILKTHHVEIVNEFPAGTTVDESKEEEPPKRFSKVRKVKLDNRTLIHQYQRGSKQALQDLCVNNEALVAKVATPYLKFFGSSAELDDIVQYGMMGLMKAAGRFDLTKEYEFSTYAVYWIKQSITRNLMNHEYMVRLPIHRFDKILKIRKALNKGEEYNTDAAAIEAVAQKLDLSKDEILSSLYYAHSYLHLVSLDLPVGEDGDTSLGEFVMANHEKEPEVQFLSSACHDACEDLLSECLDKRAVEVMRLRFGLVDGVPHTLQEIGDQMKVSRERIRQIENRAITKLQRTALKKGLHDYLEM